MDEFNQLPDALLDSALDELPLAPLPPDFASCIVAAIQTSDTRAAQIQPAHPAISFRLHFLDIALALFWSLILITISLTTLWWAGLLQFDWLPQAQSAFPLSGQLSTANTPYLLAGVILLILELSILGLVSVNVLGERPSAT